MFDLNPIFLFYALVGVSAAMLAEGVYLLCYNKASYRRNINRRLKVSDKSTDRERTLIQLRSERGLTASGDYRLPFIGLNQLFLQSGLSINLTYLISFILLGMIAVFTVTLVYYHNLLFALAGSAFFGLFAPISVLKFLRGRRQKKFSAQFPDGIDIIVRSLRAGHPVPIAIAMVAREMADPIGTEFGIVGDEITYGADLETAMRNLFFRVGTDDLPLFVTAVAIQSSTGGNLGEILENLSGVIRQRFKMRRKVRSLASEGRASAMILSSLPILVFFAIQIMSPNFYASVWNEDITKIALAIGVAWMGIGNLIMFRMVNFRI
jgi:tight adherence protein B